MSSMRMATPAAPPVPENQPERKGFAAETEPADAAAVVGEDAEEPEREPRDAPEADEIFDDTLDIRRRVCAATKDLAEPRVAAMEAMADFL